MSMKTPPQWNISSRVIILIFITQEFLFLSDGVWVSGAQLMVSPAPLADIAVDDLTECAFPLDTFQNRTTSLPISCSLEGGPIWFTLQLKSSGQTYYNFLGSKAWHRREKCPHNKQMDSKQMLEGRSKFQESSWMKEVWNNNWYNSMLLHIGRNWDVFCLPKISNQRASLVHAIKTFSSSCTQASDHLQGSRSPPLPCMRDTAAEHYELMYTRTVFVTPHLTPQSIGHGLRPQCHVPVDHCIGMFPF